MGFFDIFKSKPKDSLSTTKSFWWGNATSGTYINENTALTNAAVYACVRVISETFASLPLHVLKYQERGKCAIPEHPLYRLLHTAPNPEMTSFVFRETLMSHLLIWGNAYAQILRDNGGRVIGLYPLLPNKVDVNRDENGRLYYTYYRDLDEKRKGEQSGAILFSRDEILHIPGLSFDGLVGYSPIALAKNAVGMAIATEDYGASFFKNGATPGGVLEYPGVVGSKQSKIKESWELNFKGAKSNGKIAVLEDGLKYHPISIPPDQAQFLETRKFQLNEIARIFRIPPHMIGDLDKSTFSNIEHMSLEFVKYTLDPWVVRWEQAMEQALLLPSEQSQICIKFNVDGLLRGDYETRMKGYATGIQNGILSPNDCRELEDMNPIPSEWGDKYFLNGNMLPLEMTGAYATGTVEKKDTQE